MILSREFIDAIEQYESQKRSFVKPSILRSILCAIGIHKWTFYSKEIEVKRRPLFLGNVTNEFGEERLYIYQCECCEHSRIKIKGYTHLGDYERWEGHLKKNK